ncbi:MAG: hypothetical protein M1334_00945 [Patescibacteria group bacterium]|nr:hypothetical protein [Patescibacteria group bacterium]
MKVLFQPLVVSSAIIIAAIIGFALIFNWQISDLNSQAAQIVSQRTDLQNKIALLSALGDLKTQSAQAIQDQQKMDALLPTSDQLLDFPNWLDGLSRLNNVNMNFSFQGGQTSPTESAPGYIDFNLSLNGNLSDIINFMKATELSLPKYMINFTEINLSQSGSGVQVSLGGQLFFK